MFIFANSIRTLKRSLLYYTMGRNVLKKTLQNSYIIFISVNIKNRFPFI
jgi:hypothetical protein